MRFCDLKWQAADPNLGYASLVIVINPDLSFLTLWNIAELFDSEVTQKYDDLEMQPDL